MMLFMNYKCLECEKIDISEGIDANKSSNSKECGVCHFLYFIDKNFNYGPYYYNSCYDMSIKVISLKNLAIISVKGNTYRVNFAFMSKNDATKLLNNSNLNNKGVF